MTPERVFRHHMIKEIFEQPRALEATIAPRVSLDKGSIRLEECRLIDEEIRRLHRINIIASGTSRHAGMAGQFMIQDLASIPVDVDYASEFEYRNPLIGPCELAILITQSGETADTTGALREAKKKGSKTIAISNVVGSTIAREADGVLYTRAGKETSIASTKAFTAQMAMLYLFALYNAQARATLHDEQLRAHIRQLLELPGKLERVLESAAHSEELAKRYHGVEDFLFLGRAVHYPVAMDGALKLKEVSYVHAEGYPTGETKHGPNALIDEKLPIVIIMTCDRKDPGSLLRYKKSLNNLKGFKNQGGHVIALATEGDEKVSRLADHTIFIPQAEELISPILEIVPLQLFAYYMAVHRGLDVDRPRNLTKSVTVE
ncbi:MAG: glutamine--fructose-6-phosphate transaminase (isomerizing) [Acidobacteria bacterium]|nr:glutamine--fructose-6-phosphate transaminase (isomerizing) [Acidobacteriota bacterium]